MGNTDSRLITDEEIEANPNMYRDEDGVHLKLERGELLVQPSEEWIAKQKALEDEPTPPEPTIEEYLMDLDYRQSLLELGL